MATVFSPWAVAAEPYYAMRLSYDTDILQAEDGTEQRILLRIISVREHAYLARTIQAKHTGWLDALTYGAQTTQFAVPYWPHGTFLTANATAGSNVTLAVVDTTDRDFVAGGRAVVWADEGHAEEVTITSKTGTTIVVPTLANSYSQGAFVMPSLRGRITGDLDVSRFHAAMAEVPVTLTMEHQSDPNVASPTSALMFTTVPYMRVEVSHDLARQVARVESETYTYADYPTRVAPIGTRPFRVWVNSRSAANSLIAWFESVKGRYKSFYLPTYQDDLKVTAGLGTTTLTVERCGYTTYLNTKPERKVLAAIQPSGTVTKCTVLTAVDNGAVANTETLTLDVAAPAGTTLLSYLLYGRLESDTLELRWQNNTRAECLMGFVECPAELAPTEFEALTGPDSAGAPNVPAGPAVASQTTAVVPGGRQNVATYFTVTARDANGIRVTTGGATVGGSVTGANTATATVTDLSNGQYRGKYTPTNLGTDSVAITYNAVAIKNSPYTSVVGATGTTAAMPFGNWAARTSTDFAYGPMTATALTVSPSGVLSFLAACQASGVKATILFPRTSVKDAAGRFSLSRFQTAVDAMAAVSGINAYITNGTLSRHLITDDTWAAHWGGLTPTIADLSAACAYSKSVWSTVKTHIVDRQGGLRGITGLDYMHINYMSQYGDVTAWRARQERDATEWGIKLSMGLQIINGGDGSSGIRGTNEGPQSANWWCMTGAEITRYGKVIAASPLNEYFLCWRHTRSATDQFVAYYNLTSVRTAIEGLALFCAGEVR